MRLRNSARNFLSPKVSHNGALLAHPYCVQLTGHNKGVQVVWNVMVNISKQKLSKTNLQHINDLFLTHIMRIGDSRHSRQLLNELLTPAEKLQLAKRFAIIILLEQGRATVEIEVGLRVSRTTIASVEEKKEKGVYKETITEFNRAKKGDLWVALEKILSAGMPSQGKDRWRHVNRIVARQYRVEKRTQK